MDEREKMKLLYKELDRKEKIEFIFEYYKLHMIGGVVALVIIFSILNMYIFNPNPTPILDITLVTEYYDEEVANQLKVELESLLIEEDANETIFIEFLNMGAGSDPQMLMAMTSKFMGKASVGDLDILLMNQEYFDNLVRDSGFISLEGLFSKEVEAIFEPYKVIDPNSGEWVSVRVETLGQFKNITGNSFSNGDDVPYYPVYLGIFGSSTRIDNAVLAIEFLLQ
jgi:hypothetical protein